MNCEEIARRLPEVDPAVADHLRGCAGCRELQRAYERDAERLASGLRSRVEGLGSGLGRSSPRAAPARRFVPVAAAAAMLVGVLSVIFGPNRGGDPVLRPSAPGKLEKPSLLVIHGEGEGEAALQMIPTDHVLWAQVVAIDENRMLTVSAGRNDSVETAQQLTLYRRIQGGYREIGSLRVLDVQEATASGRLLVSSEEPRVGDAVVSGQPLTAEEKRALLDCVFSLRLRQGAGANPYDRLVRNAGLEHDVEFLARLRDPRAYDRLARILGGIPPFAKGGFPPPGPDLAPRMHEWWAAAKDRVRWNLGADRYEE